MSLHEATAPAPPQPDTDPAPKPDRDPSHEPAREPWADPGPPVRKINMPPESPSPGVGIPKPETPTTT